MSQLPAALQWDPSGPALVLLDQTQLPTEMAFLRLTDAQQIEQAIRQLQVRGAPAIGLAAAWGLVLGLHQETGIDRAALTKPFTRIRSQLAQARPTAVNLKWALDRMGTTFFLLDLNTPRSEVLSSLEAQAAALQKADEAVGLQIAEAGLSLLKLGWGLLTHCNAGALATAGWGTALAPIHLGQQRGYGFHVWADETRPLLQGSRLTAWELQKAGVDVTLICDNMAATVLASGQVQAVVVGCDRVAANGDVANKIGTLGLAILARHFEVPFYVFAPTSTLDLSTPDGAAIPIEERRSREVTQVFGSAPIAPEGITVFNPAFDVTPAALVTALVTERGVLRPPYATALQEVLRGATVS